MVQEALADLCQLRKPAAVKFARRNDVWPFADAAPLEFFSEKNDAALLVVGSSSKKRPHALTLARTFGHRLLDMLELLLDPAAFRALASFRGRKFAVGLPPLLVFAGPAFDSPVPNEYTLAKSLLLDFFHRGGGGDPAAGDQMDVEGLQYVVSVTAAEGSAGDGGGGGDATKPAIHLRVYLIRTRRSGQKLPRVDVEEMGPRMDFRFGRMRQADEAAWKEAMKRPKTTEERTKKNVSMDVVGDKMGRIHLGRQDLSQLQTRKMKGLKRGHPDLDEDVEDAIHSDDVPKKQRK